MCLSNRQVSEKKKSYKLVQNAMDTLDWMDASFGIEFHIKQEVVMLMQPNRL